MRDYEQQYGGESATGTVVNEKLAGLVTKMMRQKLPENNMTEKLKRFQRPHNVEALGCTRVNPEVWNTLQAKTRSTDIKIQKVQQAILTGVVPTVRTVESLMGMVSATPGQPADIKAEITKLLDAVSILGQANYELNLRRRELIKPDLNQQFGGLYTTQVPITGLLFGDNVTDRLSQGIASRLRTLIVLCKFVNNV